MAQPSRRGFLEVLIGGLSAVLALSFAGICAAFLSPPRRQSSPGSLLTDAAGAPVPADSIPPGGSAIGRLHGRTVIAVRSPEGELRVLSAECTHAGCLVHWNSQDSTFDCPCHGARFTARGEILRKPAPEPLEVIPIQVGSDGFIHWKDRANGQPVA